MIRFLAMKTVCCPRVVFKTATVTFLFFRKFICITFIFIKIILSVKRIIISITTSIRRVFLVSILIRTASSLLRVFIVLGTRNMAHDCFHSISFRLQIFCSYLPTFGEFPDVSYKLDSDSLAVSSLARYSRRFHDTFDHVKLLSPPSHHPY